MIEIVNSIDRDTFYRKFVAPGKPVLIKGGTRNWPALEKWNYDYFKKMGDAVSVPLKTGDVSKGNKTIMTVAEYTALLEQYERLPADARQQSPRPPYLHDVPVFLLLPALKQDVDPFPSYLLPSWYGSEWWKFVQFFMGSTDSLTPLHFDTLCTHNLFFQVHGSKKFYLVAAKDRDKCYLKSWRWAGVDLEHPDLGKYPLLKEAEIDAVVVEPGDILFMPSGTLHQVRGLSYSISFNIDWHTPGSVMSGLLSGFRGAPRRNVLYNSVVAAGLYLGIPSRYLFRYYQPYLNYVS
ncbi:cupin-like domain-containing protein [Chitinophaga qingshengii]|uniref:Cupin-like domain-containing protein n=1 Tax=Chitinophaga qingshengii TaxID=1569794 RepID=A0ABR7TYD5_9BACT|nr:cupin-like domain-containing protein [Chitinophaga qingshengii]MBC9934526.1 cupin-like domain-containing protein [Chitinophaga qingshengii]